jgi:hypothetical protein
MTVYKLTVNLDATLAVQNPNGSFHYFKPSIGAELTTDDTEDLTVLNKKFEDLYAEVIGPNFNSVVKEFLVNSEDEPEGNEKKECQCDTADSCECKPLEIVEKPEELIVHYDAATLLPIAEALPKEEWE